MAPGSVIGAAAIPSLRVLATGSAWPAGEELHVGQQWLDVDGRLVARGGVRQGRWLMDWPGLGTYRFGPFGDVEVFPVAGADPAPLQDSFVRGVIPVVLLARGHEAVHGSAVAVNGNVFAFVAQSGTGKSSLALGLAARLGSQWADDTVLLSRDPGPPQSLSLQFPPRVDGGARDAMGLQTREVPRIPAGVTLPLSRIYVVRRDPALAADQPVIADLTPAALFEGMLPHAHPFDLGGQDRRRRMLERLLAVAAGVRGCELRFAPSLGALPRLVETVAQHLELG